MDYLVSWTAKQGGSVAENEAAVKRTLALFSKWSPPAGAEFKMFVQRLDGAGGYAYVSTDDPKLVMEGPSKFGVAFDFTVTPVIDIMEGVAVGAEAIEFRDSIT